MAALGAGLLLTLWAYRSLLGWSDRYAFSQGVEYFLFRPSDSVPIVVIALSGWFLYRRKHLLLALEPGSGPVWLIVPSLMLGTGIYAWANYTRAEDLFALSLIFNGTGVVLLFWGLPGLRATWLPIVFLLFAIPLPAPAMLALVWKMQIWTADSAGWVLHLMGLPVLVSGDQIFRATQSFQVIDGCSGMKSVETMTMLCILLIDLFRRSGWHALILLVLAPPLAFLLNGVRVVTLILNPHSEIVAIHNLQGIAILLVGLTVLYLIDGLLEQHVFGARAEPTRRSRDASKPFDLASLRWTPLIGLLAIAIATSATAAFGPVWQEPPLLRPVLGQILEDALGEWRSEKIEPDLGWRGSVLYERTSFRQYRVDGSNAVVFVGLAAMGQRGGSMISPITALPGSGWLVQESREVEVPDVGPVVEKVVEKGKRRVLLHQWYHGARSLPVEVARSFLALDRSDFRRDELLYVVRIEVEMRGRGEEARAQARARLMAIHDKLRVALERLSETAKG